jgi:exopolyphosphatase/guanosine-5'-triphosphate,3'-diphosphate pyrophosphatase
LVADVASHQPKIVLHRSTGTRIGEGLRERGHLDEAAMQRTLAAMAEHLQAILEHTRDVRVIATSALRRADNENVFAERVRALTGASLEIISGEEEAACSFSGAISGLQEDGAGIFGVLDVGGGSTEYAVGAKNGAEQVVSCEIGAVRLTEAFPSLAGTGDAPGAGALAEACAAARYSLLPVRMLHAANRIVLVGGSATTAVSLVREKREYFQYAQLSTADIDAWITRLARTPLQERKTLAGINPQRADILLAGLVIVREFLEIAGHSTSLVSTNDVLLGYLLRNPA